MILLYSAYVSCQMLKGNPSENRYCRYDEGRGGPRCLKLYMTDGALQLQSCPARHYLDGKSTLS